jgi:6-phosphogluconolactonase
MGIGSDGHTASLFPDTDWQNSKSFTGYRSFRTASQPEERISLTLERLMQAEKMIFLVSGKGKEEALKKALIQKSLSIPAGYLCAKRETIWILDSEAAQALNK